ncbi:MAG: hypothetical protein PUK35_03950 [Methanomassiliicoccales archaeon]|mgnify:FL=1|uniref:DUF4443 domain-containing protein n=1 Tax=Candidatus Methanarcanum hacksteinii TaxID=2911857 RepID=UPI002A859321|nr:hypothetical protein [Methanomassiliicoccales archaeon]MDD7478987.1 hypothetical protein [Methanomassiliicoccales archaeon]MDY4581157.1 DUF4443 domain-containing protein [Candidatus Methanarcanum hacksteinii]TQS78085.1 MAG: hypothetical protein A3204_03250 [Candidatus Methanarcanum hacksteinii]
MKIIESPQYGPMFRFTDANVYWALHILSSGKRMGRKRLADEIGVGEGSMRRILETLREWEMIQIKQSGITITRSGLGFLSEIPLKVIDVDLGDSIVGDYSQSVLVFNVADKIQNGMQQRDAGIRVGATGCTTLVIRDGNLIIPPDWNMDVERPEIAKNVRATGITDKDAIIVGSGNDQRTAMMAALTAAFELF